MAITSVVNALSVDVEDYFQVSAFSNVVSPSSWEAFECRVERNTLTLLDLFDRSHTKATFFVLGWIAERYPGVVQEISLRGHEVASHGYAHRTIDQYTPEDFRQEIRSAKAFLEALIQAPVIGYRAPSFSITRDTLWALEILADEGFQYDSSIFPIHHDRYGIPGASRFPDAFTFRHRRLYEFPMSTVRLLGAANVPFGGGGYLRLAPLWFTRSCIRRVNERERQPAMVYVHPWEVDPGQPRIAGTPLAKVRHYHNLDRTVHRLEALLGEFRFAPVREVLRLAVPPTAAAAARLHSVGSA
jgi:polysaccharide deacetylase family protein (PEP-CTERM system associated)